MPCSDCALRMQALLLAVRNTVRSHGRRTLQEAHLSLIRRCGGPHAGMA